MKSKSQVITIIFAVILIFAGLVSAQTPSVPAGQPVVPEPVVTARAVGASPVPGTDPGRRAQELEIEQDVAAVAAAREEARDALAQAREQAASVGFGGRGGQIRDQAASEISSLRDVLGDLNLFSRTSAGNIDTVFFIPSGQLTSTEQLIEINEDMNIMARIFDDELNQQQIDTSDIQWQYINGSWTPNNTLFRTNRERTEGMFLQGYGAVFTLNVNFPLSPLPDTQQQQEQTEDTDSDTVWQQTRQQIYQTQPAQPRGFTTNRNQVQYDAQKVEELKTSLIDSLKHASNIRALQPDESMILSITGYSPSAQILQIVQVPGTERQIVLMQNSEGQPVTQVIDSGLSQELLALTPTVLVIRAKKSDIDAFAGGQLTSEQFRQQVAVLSYPLLSVGRNSASTSIRRGTNITQTQPPALPAIGTTGRRSSTVNAPTQSSSSSSTSTRRTTTTTSTDANSTSSNSPAQSADPF